MDASTGPESSKLPGRNRVTLPDLSARLFIWDDVVFIRELSDKFPGKEAHKIADAVFAACKSAYRKDDSKLWLDLGLLSQSSNNHTELLRFAFNRTLLFEHKEQPRCLLDRIISNISNKEILKTAIDLGFDPDIKYVLTDEVLPARRGSKHRFKVQTYRSDENSLAHLAVFKNNPSALMVMHEAGMSLTAVNSDGLTPLGLLTAKYPHYAKITRPALEVLLLNAAAEKSIPRQQHPVTIMISNGYAELLHLTVTANIPKPAELNSNKFTIFKDDRTHVTDFKGLIKECSTLMGGLISIIKKEEMKIANKAKILEQASNIFQEHYNFYDYYLYLKSFTDIWHGDNYTDSQAFVLLSRAVYSNYNLRDLKKLFEYIEIIHDSLFGDSEKTQDYDPHEAEMLLSLAHPDLVNNGSNQLTSTVVRAITSAYRYLTFDKPVIKPSDGGWMTIQNWQRIGQITHGFKRWRYDFKSAGDKECLAQSFGFKLADQSEKSKRFGKLFYFKTSDKTKIKFINPFNSDKSVDLTSDTLIMNSHAFIAAHHPELGTVLIRNSSLVFGRDVLHHAAYFDSPEAGSGLQGLELLDLTPELIEQTFAPILAREINGVPGSYYPRSKNPTHWSALHCDHKEEILLLLAQLDGVLDYYSQWQFNTDSRTVFSGKSNPTKSDLIGAYNSPGFSDLVATLSTFYEVAPEKCPELALVPAYTPPFSYYPFIDHSDGIASTKYTLKLDSFTLEVLQSLANGKVDLDYFTASGVSAFFQEAINTEAQLIMVEPSRT